MAPGSAEPGKIIRRTLALGDKAISCSEGSSSFWPSNTNARSMPIPRQDPAARALVFANIFGVPRSETRKKHSTQEPPSAKPGKPCRWDGIYNLRL